MGAFWDWFMRGTGRSGSNQWPDVNENKGKDISLADFLLGRNPDRKIVSGDDIQEELGPYISGYRGGTDGYWDDNGMWHDYGR